MCCVLFFRRRHEPSLLGSFLLGGRTGFTAGSSPLDSLCHRPGETTGPANVVVCIVKVIMARVCLGGPFYIYKQLFLL